MVVLHESFDAGAMLRDIDGYGCTLLQGVPSQYELLLKHPDSERYDLSRLRLVQIGGSASAETLAIGLLERAPRARFVSAYGITEASAVNTWTDLSDGPGVHRGRFRAADDAERKGAEVPAPRAPAALMLGQPGRDRLRRRVRSLKRLPQPSR
jgi:acyl-CoA synthetase (AMP-forming)/AMP-acid ligase II